MPDKPLITLLVLDLDNTLWDWFDIWHKSFEPFVNGLAEATKLPLKQLKAEIKRVHQHHGTSEYSFVLEEIPSLRKLYGEFNASDRFSELIKKYQQNRDAATTLYPDVMSTLTRIRATGCTIVGYTESLAFHASQRIRKMCLDGLLETVYSPPDHDRPAHLTDEQVRAYPPDIYALKETLQRATPRGVVKPHTRVLASIIREFGVPLNEVAYVGDNLAKDVLMAKNMGVTAVHAEYGESHGDSRYELLVEVSHWADQAVNTQASTTSSDVTPDIVLKNTFKEILDYLEFDSREPKTSEQQHQVIEAWKQTVTTQQHFNDLQLRLRTFMITLLVAVLGAAAFALKEHSIFVLAGYPISAAVLVCFAGLVGVIAFYYMDYGYHHLLIGAVRHGHDIERSSPQHLKCLQLAHRISEESPTPQIWFLFLPLSFHSWLAKKDWNWCRYFLKRRRSVDRLRHFYLMTMFLMVVVALFMQVVGVSSQTAYIAPATVAVPHCSPSANTSKSGAQGSPMP